MWESRTSPGLFPKSPRGIPSRAFCFLSAATELVDESAVHRTQGRALAPDEPERRRLEMGSHVPGDDALARGLHPRDRGDERDSQAGGDLLSHTASRAVPSAPKSLTSEFGMGSGVASSKSPPEAVGSGHPS